MEHRPLVQLSQSHLTLLSLCPRKYQYTYLDQLFVPTVSSQAKQQAKIGQQFHQIMQQHGIGLDVMPILENAPHLDSRFKTFQADPLPLINGDRITEHQRRIKMGNVLLVGIFDLLVFSETQGQIIDWKSYIKPKSSTKLQASWQSKLYPYLLTETSTLQPDQISMTYWFAETQAPKDSHSITLAYSNSLHTQIHHELTSLLQQFEHWLQHYAQKQAFPQVEMSQGHCLSETYQCPYLHRCQRGQPANNVAHMPQSSSLEYQLEEALDVSAIPEISL